MITLVNISRLLPNLVCALILWRSGLELLIANGQTSSAFLQLSTREKSVFSFPDDNLM